MIERLQGMAHRALGSPFVRRVAVLVGGTALGQVLLMLSSPFLTRLYGPADFGVFAVYTALLTMTLDVSALRYESAIPLARDPVTAADAVGLSLAVALVVSGLSVGVVWLLATHVPLWGEIALLRPYLWLVPIGLVGGSLYHVLNIWAIRREAYGTIARTKLSQSAGMVGTQLGLGVFGVGPLGLLIGWTLGQIGGSGTLARRAWAIERQALRRITLAGMWQVAVRYRRFPLLSVWSRLMMGALPMLPVVFLTSSYGLAVAGFFALSQRVMMPLLMVSAAVGQVYYGEVTRLIREDPSQVMATFVKTARRLTALGAAPIIAGALLAPWGFGLIFGPEWRQAGVYLQVLAPLFVIQFVASPIAGTMESMERQDLHLLSSVLRLLLLVGALLAARYFAVGATGAVALIGAAGVLGYVCFTGLCLYALRRDPAARSVAGAARLTSQ